MAALKPSLPHPLALLLIDNQKGFNHPTYWGTTKRSNSNYEKNISSLLTAFRSLRDRHAASTSPLPLIIHIYHISTLPQSPFHPDNGALGIEFLDFVTPDLSRGEIVMAKNVNSGFIGTELEAVIRRAGVRTLVIAGLTTDHCVSTTVRMAANLHVVDEVVGEKGKVVLVEDATATWGKGKWDAETVHAVSVESLRGEFAEVMGAEEVVGLLEMA